MYMCKHFEGENQFVQQLPRLGKYDGFNVEILWHANNNGKNDQRDQLCTYLHRFD